MSPAPRVHARPRPNPRRLTPESKPPFGYQFVCAARPGKVMHLRESERPRNGWDNAVCGTKIAIQKFSAHDEELCSRCANIAGVARSEAS